MKTHRRVLLSKRSLTLTGPAFLLALLVLVPASLHAQGKRKSPTSKVYVSDVNGDAQIDTGDNIQDLNKRSVYNAEGTIIETKKAGKAQDKNKVFSTMVYSNGTGAYFDEDTKVEVKRFVQEPFTPNRTDMDVEPSISQTQAFVAKGTVGLCAAKLVAGSSMSYQTAHGSVNIRGQKIVIEASDDETKISMLEGDSTVRGGAQDLGGHILHSGQQAIMRHGAAGEPSSVRIQPIPSSELTALDDKVTMACMAKKTVYFEVKERQSASGGPGTSETTSAESGSSVESTASGGAKDAPALVTAFDGPAVNSGSTNQQEIVAVPVVPANLPVQFTVSPARIVTPTSRPGGG